MRPASVRGRPSRSGASSLAGEHRADERAHHVAEERVGGDLERDHVLVDLDPPRLDRPSRTNVVCCVSVGVNARKSCLPTSGSAAASQRVEVERARMPERARRLERRALAAPPDAVAVRARARVEARVEVVRRLLGASDREIGRQERVQRAGRASRRRAAVDVDRDDVRERVHARVGAARDREAARARLVEALERALAARPRPCARPGCARPAAEARCRRTRSLASGARQAPLTPACKVCLLL